MLGVGVDIVSTTVRQPVRLGPDLLGAAPWNVVGTGWSVDDRVATRASGQNFGRCQATGLTLDEGETYEFAFNISGATNTGPSLTAALTDNGNGNEVLFGSDDYTDGGYFLRATAGPFVGRVQLYGAGWSGVVTPIHFKKVLT